MFSITSYFLYGAVKSTAKSLNENNIERGYAILSQMIGIANSGSTDGSVNHDEVIYELDAKP